MVCLLGPGCVRRAVGAHTLPSEFTPPPHTPTHPPTHPNPASPLSTCRPRLSGTTFQKDLGSLLDKSERVEALVGPLAQAAGLQGGWVGG